MNRSFFCSLAVVLVLGVLASTTRLHAQAFNQNSASFSAGYGLSALTGSLNSTLANYGITSESLTGPYAFKLEKGLTKHLGLALSTALMRNTYAVNPTALGNNMTEVLGTAASEAKKWDYSAVARLNMHVGSSKKFDPYMGAGIGYKSTHWSGSASGPDFSGLNKTFANGSVAYELGVGARYYLLPFLGVYAELGTGQSPLQGGIIFNMPGNSGGNGKGHGNGNVGGGNQGHGGGTVGGGAQGGKLKTHK